jgi:hypothetical protein
MGLVTALSPVHQKPRSDGTNPGPTAGRPSTTDESPLSPCQQPLAMVIVSKEMGSSVVIAQWEFASYPND